MELWQRLETVRQSAGWTGREFARRAGLRHDSQYGTTLARLRAGHGVTAEILSALARASVEAGYSSAWVMSGDGEPRGAAQPQRPRQRSYTPTPIPSSSLRVHAVASTGGYPNRERAVELLASHGHDASTVSEQLALVALDLRLQPGQDPPPSWWIDRYRETLVEPARPQGSHASQKR